jgi:hypothetical protein
MLRDSFCYQRTKPSANGLARACHGEVNPAGTYLNLNRYQRLNKVSSARVQQQRRGQMKLNAMYL